MTPAEHAAAQRRIIADFMRGLLELHQRHQIKVARKASPRTVARCASCREVRDVLELTLATLGEVTHALAMREQPSSPRQEPLVASATSVAPVLIPVDTTSEIAGSIPAEGTTVAEAALESAGSAPDWTEVQREYEAPSPTPVEPEPTRRRYTCSACGEPGHRASKCTSAPPEPAAPSPAAEPDDPIVPGVDARSHATHRKTTRTQRCTSCGARGHRASTCPEAADLPFVPTFARRPRKPDAGPRAFGMPALERTEPELTGVAGVLPEPIATFTF